MTASEIVMKRDDPKISWGFRLTGGADLGTPFYVVKVLGRGHAERAGLRVGDLVYAINHKYINTFSHKDAQNTILHTGDTLVLNIRRGGDMDRRGTPLPEYSDPLMGLASPPPTERPKPVPPPPYEPPPPMIKLPTPPPTPPLEVEEEEEEEETVAAFTVKINPRGRIAAIEELPVTPPRSPNRCRSRSPSRTKDRRGSNKQSAQPAAAESNVSGIPGPGQTFSYSKEVLSQYSTVLSASNNTGGVTSESINESFVIHGGSDHKMEDILSPEDIERDIFEEKMEEQKITELLTGEAELLDEGIVGINFQKIIPKTEFIKDSNVFKELQEQRIKKEESEEEQLKKDPTKRFSTFLQTPKRPVLKPKSKPPPVDDLPWKKLFASPIPEIPQPLNPPQITEKKESFQQDEIMQSSTTWRESINIVDTVSFQEVTETQHVFDETMLGVMEEGGPIITEAISTENVSEERAQLQETHNINGESCSIQEAQNQLSAEPQENKDLSPSLSKQQESSTTIEYKSEFERQLAEIQKQIEAISQLPNVLQANLTALQEQLKKIVEDKTSADLNQIEVSVVEKIEDFIEEATDENQTETAVETAEEMDVGLELEYTEEENTEGCDYEQYENMKNLNIQRRQDDELSVSKPPMIRNFNRNVMERPIVLPGGRKWYTPRDAYNEDFIAETIINQSEVLVGSTIGLNFRKYEPPKFDASNSAVFRLIQEMEEKCNGGTRLPIESRPEKVLAVDDYMPPISKRHFFAARLAEQTNEHIDNVLKESKEEDAVSV